MEFVTFADPHSTVTSNVFETVVSNVVLFTTLNTKLSGVELAFFIKCILPSVTIEATVGPPTFLLLFFSYFLEYIQV